MAKEAMFYMASPNVTTIQRPPNADSNLIKLAIVDDIYSLARSWLYELDPERTLAEIIAEICTHWSIEDPKRVALQAEDKVGNKSYLTESDVVCADLLKVLNGGSGSELSQRQKALQKLTELAQDPIIVDEFCRQGGLQTISHLIETAGVNDNTVASLLRSFMLLMDGGQFSWDDVSEMLLSQVASYVGGGTKIVEQTAVPTALLIIDTAVNHRTKPLGVPIEVDSLIRHLDNSLPAVQTQALTLMNSLFIKSQSDPVENSKISKSLGSKAMITSLENNVFRRPISEEMTHQLAVLQRLQLNTLYHRMMTPVSSQDPSDVEKIHEVRKRAFTSGSEPLSPGSMRKHGAHAKDYKKLGFQNPTNPAGQFALVPPGGLALDCLHHFATVNHQEFTRVMSENSCRSDEKQCPFAVMAVRLTLVLVELLRIGDNKVDNLMTYNRVLFRDSTEYHPFLPLFSLCAVILNKTWREMKATAGSDDSEIVLKVVHEQISRSLRIQPITLEALQEELGKYPYQTVQGIWQQEREERETREREVKPIQQLREIVKPEILQLIRNNRINVLKRGARFPKFTKGSKSQREKGKYWFWRLSDNEKFFQYDDVGENDVPASGDHLRCTLAVADIGELTVGTSNLKDGKSSKKGNIHNAISLKSKNSFDEVFTLVPRNPNSPVSGEPTDEEVCNLWTDGINALLNKDMTSPAAHSDLAKLMELEIKMRLLDVEGIEIPQEPPPIPPLPPNMNFPSNLTFESPGALET